MAGFASFTDPIDPDGQLDYQLLVMLNPGESIAPTPTVAFVDATSTSAASGTTPTVVTTSYGVVSGTRWSVVVWLNGNSAPVGTYYLRFRGQTDSTPPRKFDKTMKLEVRQT